MAAINNDYTQFVSLSAQLEGMESTLMRLKRPLSDAGERLADVSGALAARRRDVVATQLAASALAARAAALKSYLSGRELLGAASAAMERVASGGSGGGGARSLQPLVAAAASSAPSRAAALHRVALQLVRGRGHVRDARSALGGGGGSMGDDEPRLRASLDACDTQAADVEGALAPLLLSALREVLAALQQRGRAPAAGASAGDSRTGVDMRVEVEPLQHHMDHHEGHEEEEEELHLLLASLAAVGRAALAEEAISAVLSRPLFGALFTQGRVDDGQRGSFRAFPRVCDEALREATRAPGPLRTVLDAAVSSLARSVASGERVKEVAA